jgi:cardiolipin synthase
MRAGVRIYEYTPGFLHAKSFVADDRIGVVGSVNMDYRSLYLHFECGVLFVGGTAVTHLKEDALSTMAASHEVTERELSRPMRLWLRLVDAVLRALSPLF